MAALDTLRDKWENITPRERMLVVVLGIGLVVSAIVLLTMSITRRLDAMEKNNDKMRRALEILEVYRVNPKTADAAAIEWPAPGAALKVDTYIIKIAEKVDIKLGSPVKPKNTMVRPNGMNQHPYELQINGLPLEQARAFLAAIESDDPRVAITGLTMKKSFSDRENVDLKLEVSTYSDPQKVVTPPPGAAPGTGAATGAAPAGGPR